MDLLTRYWYGILDTSILELLAIATSVAYVILAARENRFCWFFGLISSCIYVWICFHAQLYLESVLQSFYVFMAFYGWYSWKKGIQNEASEVRVLGWKYNLKVICIGGFFALFLGFLAAEYTSQANPYTDAQVFCFSLFATYLVSIKTLENWLYWIAIDAASIYLYYSRGLELTAILYLFFTFFAAYGFFEWKKSYIKFKQV